MSVALVLVSAFLHAAWNALLRLEPDKDRALICAVAIAALVATGVAAVRWQVTGVPPFATGASLAWSLGAGVLELAYFTALAKALSVGSLGVVYTISRGGAVLLIWPASIAVFGEPIAPAAAIGSAIVIAGLGLASGGGTRARGVGWAIACAAGITGYHLAYKAAAVTGASPSASFAAAMVLASLINVARADHLGPILRTRLPRILAMGTLCAGSFLLLIEALAGAGAGSVLTLRNTSVLFAVGLAYAIGERPARRNVLGALLVAAGAVLIAS